MTIKKGPLGTDMTMVSVTEDRLAMLRRMQARLGEEIDVCGDVRALVLLMTRLQSVLAEISELTPWSLESPADAIAARRAARRSKRRPNAS
jgi:hypothetical protein